jgi:hypothetical protein
MLIDGAPVDVQPYQSMPPVERHGSTKRLYRIPGEVDYTVQRVRGSSVGDYQHGAFFVMLPRYSKGPELDVSYQVTTTGNFETKSKVIRLGASRFIRFRLFQATICIDRHLNPSCL